MTSSRQDTRSDVTALVGEWGSDVKITIIVISFFALLAFLTFIRLLLRKQPPTWRRLRMGFFVERDPDREAREKEDR